MVRNVHSFTCFAVFYYLTIIADPMAVTTTEFAEHPFWFKLVYMVLAGNCKLYQLTTRFVAQEANLIATGISFKAKDEKVPEEYNSIRCIDIKKS